MKETNDAILLSFDIVLKCQEIKSEHEIWARVWKRIKQNYKLAGDMAIPSKNESIKNSVT